MAKNRGIVDFENPPLPPVSAEKAQRAQKRAKMLIASRRRELGNEAHMRAKRGKAPRPMAPTRRGPSRAQPVTPLLAAHMPAPLPVTAPQAPATPPETGAPLATATPVPVPPAAGIVPPQAQKQAAAQRVVEQIVGGTVASEAPREAAAAQVAAGQAERDAEHNLNIDLIEQGGPLGFGVSKGANKTVRDILDNSLTGADGMRFQTAVQNPEVRRAFAIMKGIDPTDAVAVNQALAEHSARGSAARFEAERLRLFPNITGVPQGPGPGTSPETRARGEANRLAAAERAGFDTVAEWDADRRAKAETRTTETKAHLQERISDRRDAVERFGTDRPMAVGAARKAREREDLESRLVGVQETKAAAELAAGMGVGTLTTGQVDTLVAEIEGRTDIAPEEKARLVGIVRARGAGTAEADPEEPKVGAVAGPKAGVSVEGQLVRVTEDGEVVSTYTWADPASDENWASFADAIPEIGEAIQRGYGVVDWLSDEGRMHRINAMQMGLSLIGKLMEVANVPDRKAMARHLQRDLNAPLWDFPVRNAIRSVLIQIAKTGKPTASALKRLRQKLADTGGNIRDLPELPSGRGAAPVVPPAGQRAASQGPPIGARLR